MTVQELIDFLSTCAPTAKVFTEGVDGEVMFIDVQENGDVCLI